MNFFRQISRRKWKSFFLLTSIVVVSIIISEIPQVKALAISPLIISVIFGAFYANFFKNSIFIVKRTKILEISTKQVLRLGIILYGFRVSFQEIMHVGGLGISLALFIVISTLFLGTFIGMKLGLDKKLAILISSGSAICGAAAVLATESVAKGGSDKSVVAVSTVVLFGTIGMVLVPVVYNMGLFPLNFDEGIVGIFAGGTLHEVAHVIGAGSAISPEAEKVAVIVKMIRVLLLVPFLIILSLLSGVIFQQKHVGKKTASIPWFAIWFLVACGVNSIVLITPEIKSIINWITTILLTYAMCALGMKTHYKQLVAVGKEPFILAIILFIWLGFSGFSFVYLFS